MVPRRDEIWETLTMSLLPMNFSTTTWRSCFSTLWMPEGRGAIPDLALIKWIDDNASFRFGEWTLREWSQARSRNEGEVGKQHAPRDLDIFIENLDRVLGSGMRLATAKSYDYLIDLLFMVHPYAEKGDLVYVLQGCGMPVVLRALKDPDFSGKYEVVGGAYLYPIDMSRSDGYNDKLYDDLVGGNHLLGVVDPDIEIITLC